MRYEPPPNPADWIGGADLFGQVTDAHGRPGRRRRSREERLTWDALRPALRRMEASCLRCTAR